MIIVADAAPVTYLARINQLALIPELFSSRTFIPTAVHAEILAPNIPPDEERLLTLFVSGCEVIEVEEPGLFASGLSFADNCVLTLAHGMQADLILSDDRSLRKVAALDGFRAIGTIGVLFHAKGRSLLTADEGVHLLDRLVDAENFRISTQVYRLARSAFFEGKPSPNR